MTELIEKKLKTANTVLAITIIFGCITAFGYVGVMVSAILDKNFVTFFPFMFVGMILLLIFFSIYANKYLKLVASVKWLKSNGMENVADDIDLENPTFAKAKIYCGKNALLCKKPWAIIPYSEFAWAYLHESRVNGITVEKLIYIHTKSGKRFVLNCSIDEFKILLNVYAIRHCPDIILGYGVEQIAKYAAINPNSGKIWKCKRIIPGILLLLVGIIMFVAAIASAGKTNAMGWILSAAFFAVGAVLTAIGIRGKKDNQ